MHNLEQTLEKTPSTFFNRLRTAFSRYTTIGMFLGALGLGIGCSQAGSYSIGNNPDAVSDSIVEGIGAPDSTYDDMNSGSEEEAGMDFVNTDLSPSETMTEAYEEITVKHLSFCYKDDDNDGFTGYVLAMDKDKNLIKTDLNNPKCPKNYFVPKKVNGVDVFDCDDTNADINPVAYEICGNDKDENCDFVLDDGCGNDAYVVEVIDLDVQIAEVIEEIKDSVTEATLEEIIVDSALPPSDNGVIVFPDSAKDSNSNPDTVVDTGTDTISAPIPCWEKTFGGQYDDKANSVKEVSKGFVVVGETVTGNDGTTTDAIVVKTDKSGNVLWQDILDYGNISATATSVVFRPNMGYVVTGKIESTAFMFGSFITKYDSDGNIEWKNDYGGKYMWSSQTSLKGVMEWTTLDSVTLAHGYGYVATGMVADENVADGTATPYQNVWVVKFDESGNILWQKSYGYFNNDRGFSIASTLDGGYIVAGEKFTPGELKNAWLLKLDQDGNYEWDKEIGTGLDDSAKSVIQDADGNFYVTGNLDNKIFAMKLDSAGNEKWQNNYGNGVGYSIISLPNLDIILAGIDGSGHNDSLSKLDPSGNVLWEKEYGSASSVYEGFKHVTLTSQDKLVVCGFTNGGGLGQEDIWLLKLDYEGEMCK